MSNNHGYNPADHYWLREDGRIYSSARQAYIDLDNPAYQAWVKRGGSATRFPKGPDRKESDDEMRVVLKKHGLAMFPGEVADGEKELLEKLAARVTVLEEENAALRSSQGREDGYAGETLYRLNSAGTLYHTLACSYGSETATQLSLSDIAAKHPSAKPCGRCAPPESEGQD